MPLNTLFPHGTYSEQSLVERLIIESIKMYGREFFYIPRTLVNPDAIFGEDPLSMFEQSYMIECYIDNVQEWGGGGSFISKFGYTIEDQGQLTIAKRRWEELVGRYGESLLPNRPTEGDLMYFPTAKSLFEIKYVEHQNPFYQLGRLYVYKLKIELFQYSSERLNTDIDEINQIALDMTFDVLNKPTQDVIPAKRDFFSNDDFKAKAENILDFSETNPFGETNDSGVYPAQFVLDHIIVEFANTGTSIMNTRSRIMSSYFGGLFVGENMQTNTMNMIQWAGSGTNEYVYINAGLIKQTFPELAELQFDFRALWFNAPSTAPINLTITGYTGGTLTQTGNVYSITGYTQTKSMQSVSSVVADVSTDPTDIGQRIASVLIGMSSGQSNIIT